MPKMQLVHYEQARRALAEAHRLDEVKDIADKVEAMRLYARQAKDPDMEIWLAEIRLRALRRLGELSRELEKATPSQRREGVTVPGAKRATLADVGLSTSAAHRCEQIASIDEEDFEAYLDEKKAQGKPVTVDEVVRKVAGASRRQEKIDKILGAAGVGLSEAGGAYAVLYADPPWKYEYTETKSRAIENQYPTMTLDEICALEPPAADDSVLFLWATSPKLTEALSVLEAWNFTYRTCMVWVKDKIGMGYYARQQHELLLIGTRGSLPVPAPEQRPSSVVVEPRGVHSEKPKRFYGLIEAMYPEFDGLRLEMFARQEREGWAAWGYEVQ
jgi:N6-adenosine-specific RNA methylase IME4